MGQLRFQQQLREIPLKTRNYSVLASLVARVGPFEFARLYKKYPWIPLAARIHELMDHAHILLGQHYEVLRMLHEEEGSHRVPTAMFGRWITERSGEHRGEFDIKRSGLIFVVEGVRILALLHGEYFEGAYRFLLHFALNAQVEKAVEDGHIDTYLNPSSLSSREKEMLRHAYKAVASLQELIASEFGELVI